MPRKYVLTIQTCLDPWRYAPPYSIPWAWPFRRRGGHDPVLACGRCAKSVDDSTPTREGPS